MFSNVLKRDVRPLLTVFQLSGTILFSLPLQMREFERQFYQVFPLCSGISRQKEERKNAIGSSYF